MSTLSFFKNKTIVVTGGSDGIGRAIVESLIASGAKVATCGRSYDKLYDLQLQNPSANLHAVTCDVSNQQDCERFIASTITTFGDIDILINNAGISMRSLFKDAEIDMLKKVMDINFWGAVYCTHYALPSLIKNQGTIVGVSSIAGYRGLPGRSGYSASKYALQGWLESLRTELLNDNVNVMWVSPGFTSSNIRNAALDSHGKPQGASPLDESRLMTAQECADIILRAIEHKRRTVVMTLQGKTAVLLNRFFPKLADKFVHKSYFKNGELIK